MVRLQRSYDTGYGRRLVGDGGGVRGRGRVADIETDQ